MIDVTSAADEGHAPETITEHLDRRIQDLVALERQIRDLRSYLQRYRNLQSIIQRLPPEILSLIFVCGQELHGIGFELAVSQTCHHWRTVALETRALWSTIEFQEGAPFDKSAVWLGRAHGHPLHVSIPRLPNSTDLGLALSLLSPQAHRLASLSFTAPCHSETRDITPFLRQLVQPRRPCELISLALVHPGVPDADPELMTNFKQWADPDAWRILITSVRCLEVNGVHVPWHVCTVASLTTLRLSNLSTGHCSVIEDILRSSPALTELNLWDVDWAESPSPLPPIHLPLLRKLGFTYGSTACRALVQAVEAPHLKSLCVGGATSTNVPTGALTPLLVRYTASLELEQLGLESCNIDDLDWKGLASRLCRLTCIVFSQCNPRLCHRSLNNLPHSVNQLRFRQCIGLSLEHLQQQIIAKRQQLVRVSIEECYFDDGGKFEAWLRSEGL